MAISKNKTGNLANRGLMKKGGSTKKYQTGGTAVEPKRKAGDTVYGKTVPKIEFKGATKTTTPARKRPASTAGPRYSGKVGYNPITNVASSKMKKGGSTKKK